MARHKMSLSVEYVSDWGVQEALRELFQNCIDHGNWEFKIHNQSDDTRCLILRSKGTALTTASLLLGHSRKSEGAIGKFGEGYKLAVLVLTRLGYKVTIDTADEVWTPKLIDSRTYKTKQLVFDTTKSKVALEDLIFTVEGLSEAVIEELKFQNLHVVANEAFFAGKHGIAIEDRPGDIFVNGLFVANLEGYKFGYNFKPEHLKLDRDRRLVRDFDVQWLTSQLWLEYEDTELVLDMISKEIPDVKHVDYHLTSSNAALADTAAKAFLVEHGVDAVPVSTQSDLEKAKEDGHEKVILMPSTQKTLIYRSSGYSAPPPRIVRKTPREELLEFSRKWRGLMIEGDMQTELDTLIDKAERWYQ